MLLSKKIKHPLSFLPGFYMLSIWTGFQQPQEESLEETFSKYLGGLETHEIHWEEAWRAFSRDTLRLGGLLPRLPWEEPGGLFAWTPRRRLGTHLEIHSEEKRRGFQGTTRRRLGRAFAWNTLGGWRGWQGIHSEATEGLSLGDI
jgi:hypothetical protein